uniref:SDR family NAD(P)-dependent oxidoreductase n=1 Tax=uncultured Sphingomonas sp. TaxID=158754 RepID=UPI0035CBC41D
MIEQHVATLDVPVDLSGRTALVTGATAGIGRAVAEQCARAGATTILAGRDAVKLAAVAVELEAIAPGRLFLQLVDLADLSSIRAAATALCAQFRTLDIVIANASIMVPGKQRTFTRDGFEATFGVNHVGNAALLLGLEKPIRAAASSRVVIVASEAHRRSGGLPLDDLMGDHSFGGTRAYARSKLANILFARQLAERWPGTTVYAAHPGAVLTAMMRTATAQNALFRLAFRLMRSLLLSPAQAAAGLVRIATDPALADPSGTYFEIGRRDTPGALADDRALGRALFDRTLALIDDPPASAPAGVEQAPLRATMAATVATGAATTAVGGIAMAIAARRAGVSVRAWLLLKLVPLMAGEFRDAAGLEAAIRKNRECGPTLPSATSRKRFGFADEMWGEARVLRLGEREPATPLTFLYLHGGAYVLHIQAGQWGLPVAMLHRLGGEVVAPLYPLAPERDWRAGNAAVREVYLRLVAERGADTIVVVGDSAGGGLALALAQALRDGGSPLPAALVLFSPWLDISLAGEDQPAIERLDPALSIAFLRAAGAMWASGTPADDPRISPLFGDPTGLPPILVLSGTRDILDSDALRLKARAPEVTLKRYPGMFHVWAAAPIPEGRRALDEAATFVRETLER